ncbi:MAG: hypothetical protein DMG39_22145 [Acidobacteria bacterium]|nr:MAG: hypothetical protein DMG39_22145 [Acidobacteriota bacterium]
MTAKTAKERIRVDREGNRAERERRQRRFERGEGKLKGILIVTIVVLGIYTAWKILPPYVNDYQLADKMQEQSRYAMVNRYTEDQIRDNIYKIMQDLDIPARREDIKIVANGNVVKISLDYTVPVDVLMYHTDLHFSPNSETKSLL